MTSDVLPAIDLLFVQVWRARTNPGAAENAIWPARPGPRASFTLHGDQSRDPLAPSAEYT